MKFLIDHSKQRIHRSTFVEDRCEFHTSPIDERMGTYDEGEVMELIKKQDYVSCSYCSPRQ